MARKKIRTISYRPGLTWPDTPFLALGGKWLREKYGWEVGGLIEVWELPAGIFIKKIQTPVNPNQMTLDDLWKGGEYGK